MLGGKERHLKIRFNVGTVTTAIIKLHKKCSKISNYSLPAEDRCTGRLFPPVAIHILLQLLS